MNFYIADTHFGHENILRLCNRPFSNIDEMDYALIQNWNSRVRPSDNVYVVGDFAFRSTNAVDIARQLNGNKYLIIGNHDGKNLKNPDFKKCFVNIQQMMDISDNGERIILCHYPIVEWNGYFRGSYLVYGHIHNNITNQAYKIMSQIDKALNAGVDITGFMPVNFSELKEANNRFIKISNAQLNGR